MSMTSFDEPIAVVVFKNVDPSQICWFPIVLVMSSVSR